MAFCDPLDSGIGPFCGLFNLGGIAKAYIADYDKVDSLTFGSTYSPTIVTEIGMTDSGIFYEFDFREDTSTFNQDNTPTNSSDIVSQVGTLIFQKNDTSKNDVFNLLRGKKLVVIYYDSNGNYWLSGAQLGARITSIVQDFGTDRNDPNIATLTITAREPHFSYEVESLDVIPLV